MTELIKIINNENRQVVSSKEFYKALEGEPTVWSKWVKDNITKNPFAIQGEDWEQIQSQSILSSNYENKSKLNETRGRPTTDYLLTIPFAKKLAMLTRTKKGEEIRDYFIEIEKKYKAKDLQLDNKQLLAKAFLVASDLIKEQTLQLEEMKPKADFYDAVTGSKDCHSMKEAAKLLDTKGYGRNNLFEFLRSNKVLDKNNLPYQKYINLGWFRVVESKYTVDDETRINLKTMVYQKGLDGIRRLLEVNNV